MGDVILSALQPGSIQIQSINTDAFTQNAPQVPREIANLPLGSLLKGFVINRDGQNNPVLRTERGDVLVRSELFLKTGSEVVIRVNTQSGQSNARIVSVDNIPLKELLDMAQQNTPKSDVILQPSWAATSGMPASATGSSVSVGMAPPGNNAPSYITLEGVLLKPASYGTPQQSMETIATILKMPLAQLPNLDRGMTLQFQVLSHSLPTGDTPDVMALAFAETADDPSATSAAATTRPATAMQKPSIQPPSLQYTAYSKAVQSTGSMAGGPAAIATQSSGIPSPLPIANPAAAPLSPAAAPLNMAEAIAAMNNAAASDIPDEAMLSTALRSTPAGIATSPPAAATTIAAPVIRTTLPSIALPQNDSAAPASARAGTLTATVIGHEPSGEIVVRSAIGTIKLFTTEPLPVGSNLQLALIVGDASPLSRPMLPPLMGGITAMDADGAAPSPVSVASHYGRQWDALEQSALAMRTDMAHGAALMERIPNTKSALVNSALFFISALKSGDMRRWIGNGPMQRLEETNPKLAAKLGADFSAMHRLATDASDANWQLLLFPLLHDDELHQARLYVRRDGSQGEANSGMNESRFMLEVSLSEMGEVQIDGYYTRQLPRIQCDLIIRTEQPLDAATQGDLRAIYYEAADVAGFTGQLQFREGLAQFQRPMQDISAHQNGPSDASILA